MHASANADIEISANDSADSASLAANQNSPNFKFERPDWALFRSVGTLSQKAGVPKEKLRRLVLKELADNALDAGARVTVTESGALYTLQDDGPGIAGTPEEIARMFSRSAAR